LAAKGSWKKLYPKIIKHPGFSNKKRMSTLALETLSGLSRDH
jgi:hypothetical protein